MGFSLDGETEQHAQYRTLKAAKSRRMGVNDEGFSTGFKLADDPVRRVRARSHDTRRRHSLRRSQTMIK